MTSHRQSTNWSGLRERVSSRMVIAAVALVFGVLFVLLNDQRVRIHFVFFTVSSRLWIGFLVCLVTGGLLGQGLGMLRHRRGGGARPRDHA